MSLSASGTALLAVAVLGCEPELVVGSWTCPASPREENDAGVLEPVTGAVAAPWSTGFEQGLCDYYVARGYCYERANSSYQIVTTPVHAGGHAVAFTVQSDLGDGQETRCVREGTLPVDAYYGAWYYIPERFVNGRLWNLLHFQGGELGTEPHNLWDVSIDTADDGTPHLFVLGSLGAGKATPTPTVPLPIGSWFHVEFRLRRAADDTGLVELYQDGTRILELPSIRTDDADWNQWYVGNLATALTPPASTLYVDDISIRPAP